MKTCVVCGEQKLLQSFKAASNGERRPKCRLCENRQRKDWKLVLCVTGCGKQANKPGYRCHECTSRGMDRPKPVAKKKKPVEPRRYVSPKQDNHNEQQHKDRLYQRVMASGTPIMILGGERYSLSSTCVGETCSRRIMFPGHCYECATGRKKTITIEPLIIYPEVVA